MVSQVTRTRARTRRRRASRRTVLLLAALLSPLPLVGCGGVLHGRWRMVEVVPNKEVFNIDDASFNRDGTYAATTTFAGKTNRETGTYRFNGFKLFLHPHAGGRRAYNAALKFNRLELLDGQRKVVLKRD